jgi:hypothetical protein
VYVYRRPDWLPRAWLAGSYEITPDPVGRVSQPDFDPRTIALLETAPPCAPEEGGGTTEIVEEAPDHVTLAAEAEGPALLIYSGQFYPGWMAAVDGEPAEVLRADAVLRAVCVPAGRHTITMTFWPGSLVLGGVITVGMAVMIGIAGWRYRRGGGQRQA